MCRCVRQFTNVSARLIQNDREYRVRQPTETQTAAAGVAQNDESKRRPHDDRAQNGAQTVTEILMDAASPASESQATNRISDQRFADQLDVIKKLKKFLFEERILLPADVIESIDLGPLNNLKFASDGRLPTETEWRALDEKLAGLTPLLTTDLRWKFRIRELRFFFITIPIFFMGMTVIATLSLVLLMSGIVKNTSLFFLVPYVIAFILWTFSQGGLGACAFLCVTATLYTLKERAVSGALHQTIDVTDKNILGVRVILGGLFALLIALPIGGKSVLVIYMAFTQNHSIPPTEDWIIALLPFMLGFSTTLVLAIFNRVIAGISALFGIASGTGALDD
jgi:hypothetical protein